jgi:hypothetical protein
MIEFIRRATFLAVLLFVQQASTQTLSFLFRNVQVIGGPKLQYEVWIKSSDGTSKMGSILIYNNYSTQAFGENVVGNGKVTVTKNATDFNALYGQNASQDNGSSTFAYSWTWPKGIAGFGVTIPSTGDGVKAFTVTIDLVDANANPDISFGALMDGQQYKDDEIAKWPTLDISDAITTPLPIQLASSAANVVRGNDVEVGWKTVSETNNYGFEVYRKRGEAGEWTKVGFVEGHGTTLAPQSYSYIDRSLSFGQYFYRIKQIDLDGKSETFPEMAVMVGAGADKFVLAQNYPNPFNPSTLIEFVVPVSGHTTMKVYNVLGQEVATLFEGDAEADKINVARFNASNLPSGLYFYTLRSAGKVETKRMLLMK